MKKKKKNKKKKKKNVYSTNDTEKNTNQITQRVAGMEAT